MVVRKTIAMMEEDKKLYEKYLLRSIVCVEYYQSTDHDNQYRNDGELRFTQTKRGEQRNFLILRMG
jgi:hypothetical protein